MKLFSLPPVKVKLSILKANDSRICLTVSWSADGKILWWNHNFGSYWNTDVINDLYYLRPNQDLVSLGMKFNTPLGVGYVGILDDRKTIRIQDVDGNCKDFIHDFEKESFFSVSFIENDVRS